MKIQSELRNALIVLACGGVVVILSQWVHHTSRKPSDLLIQIQGLEIQLGETKVLAEEVAYGGAKVNDLMNHIKELPQRFIPLDKVLPIEGNRFLETLTSEADKISSIYARDEKQSPHAQDSTKEHLKADYQTMISRSKENMIKSIQGIEALLTDNKHQLQQDMQQAELNHTIFMLFISSFFLTLAFITYKSFRSFAVFKYQTQTRSEKESSRLETLGRFVEAIANGRYTESIEFESGDQLAERLVEMKTKLLTSAETDRKRNWATQGMAEIGTILRDASALDKLYVNITRFCVKYTGSNQASFFVMSSEGQNDHYLELVSTYAYDRQKYFKKKIQLGEGLLGQAVLEARTINMTRLPANYLHITSGLGDALPNALVIVPLKVNEVVFGVLELASFKPYEDYEIKFLELLGESVASAISTARINDQTKTLLEKSQQQMEELRAQEEEVRQNMEELSATQEQMARQMEESRKMAEELQVRENVFALTTILSESDPFGTITLANNKLVEVSKYSRQELIGKPHSLFRHPDMPKELFKLFWETIKQGEVFRGIIKNRAKDGTHYWVDATIVPVKDSSGKIVKFIGARYHITNDQFAEYLYNSQAERLHLPSLQIPQRVA